MGAGLPSPAVNDSFAGSIPTMIEPSVLDSAAVNPGAVNSSVRPFPPGAWRFTCVHFSMACCTFGGVGCPCRSSGKGSCLYVGDFLCGAILCEVILARLSSAGENAGSLPAYVALLCRRSRGLNQDVSLHWVAPVLGLAAQHRLLPAPASAGANYGPQLGTSSLIEHREDLPSTRARGPWPTDGRSGANSVSPLAVCCSLTTH